MDIHILGALEVRDGDRALSIKGRKRRALLAALVVHLNEAVSTDRLIEELWAEHTPKTALQALRVHVSQIRKTLGEELVRTTPAGYVLDLPPDQLDAWRFERLVAEGTAVNARGDAGPAAAVLREALSLWRGPALADFTYEPFAQAEAARLEELKLAALEVRIDADLALGDHPQLIAELEALVAANPFRERLRAQLMLALYGAGRQSDALAAFRDARATLVQELGLEPSAELSELESAILRHEPSLSLGSLSPQRMPPQPSVRKTVTVLYVDAGPAGEGASDPETLARRLAGPLELGQGVVARHDGVVTAQAADALTAAFGIPALHEDDALRAVRAAVDLREQLDELGLRIGIATGEVVASGAAPPVGAAGGSAARLAHSAQPGEIVLDDATRRLVENAVDVMPVRDAAFRLQALLPGAPPFVRHLEASLVGRRGELGELVSAFEQAVAESEQRLLVVVGLAGIGKSRLAGELLTDLSGRATALVGRCLSYGEGMTLWPLREIVRQAAGDESRQAVAALMRGERDGNAVADRIAAALGVGDERSAEEALWAFRRLLETVARARPHVLVIEDVHWAEPALLDLLEYVAREAGGVPLLIVCLARPELLEARPSWAAFAIELRPLSSEETRALIENLPLGRRLVGEARGRVVAVSEGNPLFAEQLVALLAADGVTASTAVAPTIHAILAARLDRLGPGERAVVERAAVVGREFTLEAVAELMPAPAASSTWGLLRTLARKQLVQPDDPILPGERGFRFEHALIHDAAYRRLPKETRADLHERLGGWLEQQADTRRIELDEMVGYHLEQACRYRLELDPNDQSVRTLAERAAARLGAAGRRAYQRTDFHAAVSLLTGAIELLPEDDPASVDLLNIVGTALGPIGEFERGRHLLDEAIVRARRLGDRKGEWQARLERRWISDGRESLAELRREAGRALRVFEEVGDPLGAARASAVIAFALSAAGRGREACIWAERALAYARAAGVHREQVRAHWALAAAFLAGPLPVPAAIVRCEELLAEAPDSLVGTVGASLGLGVLRAMNGEFEAARELAAHGHGILKGIAHPRPLIFSMEAAGRVEALAGDPARAERLFRDGLALARDIRWSEPVAGLTVRLADVLCVMGRPEEAAEQLEEVAQPGKGSSDGVTALWHSTRARVDALQGHVAEAESLAREAAALIASTDLLDLRGDIQLALAEVLWAAGRAEEATAALEAGVRFYRRKGNLAAIAKARTALPLRQPV